MYLAINRKMSNNRRVATGILFVILGLLLPAVTTQATDMPSAFDLRDIDGHSYIGPVRNQGQCGSCYSFGSLAAAESSWNRAHNLTDDQTIDLSEAFMVWSLSPLYDRMEGCAGASASTTMLALLENGVPLESDFPYTIADPGQDLHWDAQRYTFDEEYTIPTLDIETSKRVMESIGAVAGGLELDMTAWGPYTEGVFADDLSQVDGGHMIALVGWDDAPEDGGTGYWILRNSWSEKWGEDGYMRIRYTSAEFNDFKSMYLVAAPWNGENLALVNDGTLEAVPWSAGGTLNAHGVDLWGGAASSVTNHGEIRAEAVSVDELATARGVYLWGGPEGYVVNEGRISATADSQDNKAISYGACLQGGLLENHNLLTAEAASDSDLALAYGVWAANGGSLLEIRNSGEIVARSGDTDAQKAYGIYSDNRALTQVLNTGNISAYGGGTAAGVKFNYGPARLVNSGTILAAPSSSNLNDAYGVQANNDDANVVEVPNEENVLEILNSGEILVHAGEAKSQSAYGVYSANRAPSKLINTGTIAAYAGGTAVGVGFQYGPVQLVNSGKILAAASSPDPEIYSEGGYGIGAVTGQTQIVNSGTISGTTASVWGQVESSVTLELTTGSNLIGSVDLFGIDNHLLLTGYGSEDEDFIGVDDLTMDGSNWSLSGDSAFAAIQILNGRLGVDGALAGEATILADGILGGNGTLTGRVTSSGVVAPGASVGHLTIDGDYSQNAGGTLAIETGNGTADLLTVTGTAELAGSLLVLPDGYASGGTYTFLDAGTLTGDFDQLHSVAVLGLDLYSNSPGTLTLDITRNSYSSLATPHNLGLGGNLDNIRSTAAGDLSNLLNRLDLAVSIGELNSDLNQLTPRIHGLASTLTLGDSQARLNDLRQHMNNIDPAGSNDTNDLWVNVLGHYSRDNNDGGYFSAREDLYGMMLGMERTARSGLTLGVAAAVTKNSYESDDTDDKGEGQSLQGYLYGSWRGRKEPSGLHLTGALGAGGTELSADRAIAFASRRTHGEHNGQIYSATLQGRYDWTSDGWLMGPTLGVSAVHLRENSFRETGAESADLQIKSRTNDSLQSLLGGRIAHPLTAGGVFLEPELRVEWRHEFDRNSANLESRLAGGGDYFITPGRDLADDSLLLGIALKTKLRESIIAGLSYDCNLRSSEETMDQALALQVTVPF